jgi:hypothetical protein
MVVPDYARYTLERDLYREGWVMPQSCHDEHLWNSPFNEFLLVPVRSSEDEQVGDAKMLRFSQKFGANVPGECAMAIFLDNQDKIPEKFRDGLILFPGVVVLDPRGHRFIGVLYYAGDSWQRDFYIVSDEGKDDINTWEDDYFVLVLAPH